jgi:ADP-ribose pyrophosphatase YjhB (NUDIX family)
MAPSSRYRRLGRRLMCENRMFHVYFDKVEAPDGEVIDDFLIVRPKVSAPGGIVGVCVLPEVEGRIGLMRGYRHQLDEDVWQAPAGFIDPGETAEQTALRELAEETALACQPENLQGLGVYCPDAGLVEGKVAIFAARNCVPDRRYSDVKNEIGASALQFFGRGDLAKLINESGSIGGSTLVACFRYLAVG